MNSKSCRNLKLCVNVHHKYRKDVVWAAILCFAYLKVKDTEDRILSDRFRFEFSTPELCKNKREKICTQCLAKSMFHISAQAKPAKYTHFQKKEAIFSYLKKYMPSTNLNTTQIKYIHIWVQKT